jgi:hypothetical protein
MLLQGPSQFTLSAQSDAWRDPDNGYVGHGWYGLVPRTQGIKTNKRPYPINLTEMKKLEPEETHRLALCDGYGWINLLYFTCLGHLVTVPHPGQSQCTGLEH